MVKIVLVTADYDPLRGKVKRVLREVSQEKNVELEIRNEDWDFLIKYGEKDELGGFDLPQVFIVDKEGNVKHIITRVPLDEKGKPRYDYVKELVIKELKKLESSFLLKF